MSEHMVRKQIYLPRRQNLALRRIAKERGVSEAEVIRQALEREADVKATTGRSGTGSWFEILRFVHERWESATPASKPVEWGRQELYGERESRWLKEGDS